MTVMLRVMLDQVVAPASAVMAEASRELARALVLGAPSGCAVEAIVPSGGDGDIATVSGVAEVRRVALQRRELAAALQLGVGTGIGGGMIHSPTLLAPLVRHDRVHDNDQTVVTLWDTAPWDHPTELARPSVTWHKAMLKRAVKHADAMVVPTHSIAERVAEIAPQIADRLRVISGAAPLDFRVPSDDIGRRRALDLPEGFLLLSGDASPSHALATGFGAIAASGVEKTVVVLDVPDGAEPAVADIAAAAGIAEHRLHVRGSLDVADRAAVMGGALAYLAPARTAAFPWRLIEALTVGVPVLAADSAVHREVLVDGGRLIAGDGDERAAMADALAEALGSTAAVERLSILSADRGRVFSWREAADKVWQLHAEL